MIPYGRQDVIQDDIDAVVAVLKSDFLTQGPVVPLFEAALAEASGAEYAIAVNSATSALHIACAALNLGPGDTLWTSPVTFVASANCARYCGANVDFVDVERRTGNMCPDALAHKLAIAAERGTLPKVLVPVHLAGQSCEMARIGTLARLYGVRVVEDASHAVGGRYDEQPVGVCAHSDMAVFSFHPVKIITTAEGGAVVTQNHELAKRLRRLRSHGITRDAREMTHPPEGPWYYQQIELGWNYRLTELQAALGVSQIKRLTEIVARRNALADRYDRLLADFPVVCPARRDNTLSSFHLYVIRVPAAHHREIFEGLLRGGIGANLHYIPVHLQPYYRDLGNQPGDFPEAEQYYREAISLPLYAGLTEEMQDSVVECLRRELEQAGLFTL